MQCINVTDVKWITQQKTVVERVCSDVPDQVSCHSCHTSCH